MTAFVSRRLLKKKAQRRKRILVCSLLSLGICILGWQIFQPKESTQIAIPALQNASTAQQPEYARHRLHPLTESLRTTIEAEHYGRVAILIEELTNGDRYAYRTDDPYTAGSLYKLWLMGTAFESIDSGSLELATHMRSTLSELYSDFSLDPPQKDRTISLTVDDAITRMITISDNDAALLLAKTLGLSTVRTWMTGQGYTQSRLSEHDAPPQTTAEDIASFYRRIWKEEVPYAREQQKILRDQRLNDKLTRYFPAGITMAHKTGELDDYSHDAGILAVDDRAYIIVVLTQFPDRETANNAIADFGRELYTSLKSETNHQASATISAR
jgi:beta-lactamase class A